MSELDCLREFESLTENALKQENNLMRELQQSENQYYNRLTSNFMKKMNDVIKNEIPKLQRNSITNA